MGNERNSIMDKATINEIIQFLKDSLIKNGLNVDSIALFGSALTGEMREDSFSQLIQGIACETRGQADKSSAKVYRSISLNSILLTCIL